MTHWDGLASSSSSGVPQRICILGATNRIQDIDEAILRRMPKKFPVSLPTSQQRRGIFKLILRDTKVDKPNFNLDFLVRVTAGMSGSDIKEACRDAAMCPVREYIKQKKASGDLMRGVDPREVRGLRTDDFFGKGQAARKMKEVDEKDRIEEEATSSENRASTESETESSGEEFQEPEKR